tara:strand:+ start:622 stop:798 length:177 start_codon:yes stop_codon:yes gene_type:complete
MELDDVMADLFQADKAERRKILKETMYRIKWENMRRSERKSTREKSMVHRGDTRRVKK